MHAMLAAVNGVKVVIVENSDRWGRDTEHSINARRAFQAVGAVIYDAAGNDLTSTLPSLTFNNNIQAAMAEYAKDQLVQRLFDARMRKGERGSGRIPYGLQRAGTKEYALIPNPTEQAVIAKIRELATQKNVRQITLHLNAEGLRTRHGKTWHPDVVARLLRRA